MASISVYRQTDKGPGPVRFRLSDGRGVCLYWSAGARSAEIMASDTGLERYKGIIARAYEALRREGKDLSSRALRRRIELIAEAQEAVLQKAQGSPLKQAPCAGGTGTTAKPTASSDGGSTASGRSSAALNSADSARNASSSLLGTSPLVQRYLQYLGQAHRGGFIGTPRYRQCCNIAARLERWLVISGHEGLAPEQFDSDVLLSYRQFLFDEHSLVPAWPQLYPHPVRIPRKRRKCSSVVLEMKALKAFFTELENQEEIRRSPFRSLSREKQKSIMHVMYDAPVFLRKGEFAELRNAQIPKHLDWVRELFLFNCCVGCRIGDVVRLSPRRIEMSEDGIPYIHYIPSKTRLLQSTNREIETPLVPLAYDIARKGLPRFRRATYNALLKQLLRECGMVRKVRVYNELRGENDYLPLWQVASSKLARKTHVDMLNKVQLDPWVSGLHREGSEAVFRYTRLELQDRYRMLLLAFGDS